MRISDFLRADFIVHRLEGRKGALLQVFSVSDGSLLRSHSLSSPPVFDGLSAAHGRLYLATLDGKIICFAGEVPLRAKF